jgi:hypothetical protein
MSAARAWVVLACPFAVLAVACGGGITTTAPAPAPAVPAEKYGTWKPFEEPAWVEQMPAKSRDFWRSLLKDKEPLYTAVRISEEGIRVSVARTEWGKLTAVQARNHLMFAVMLPHEDQTPMEYVDDTTGERLATFTAKTPVDTIRVVHP